SQRTVDFDRAVEVAYHDTDAPADDGERVTAPRLLGPAVQKPRILPASGHTEGPRFGLDERHELELACGVSGMGEYGAHGFVDRAGAASAGEAETPDALGRQGVEDFGGRAVDEICARVEMRAEPGQELAKRKVCAVGRWFHDVHRQIADRDH